MGRSERLAAAAALSHAKHYYNHTQPTVVHTADATNYNVNVFFVSATICGVLVAMCASCWRRSASINKPEEVAECRGVYTVSNDARLIQIQEEIQGPPPAYDSVVETPPEHKHDLQEVTTELCCKKIPQRSDSGLPSYEAAVLLKDTRL